MRQTDEDPSSTGNYSTESIHHISSNFNIHDGMFFSFMFMKGWVAAWDSTAQSPAVRAAAAKCAKPHPPCI